MRSFDWNKTLAKLAFGGFLSPVQFRAIVYAILIVAIASIWKNVGPPVTGFTWKQAFRLAFPFGQAMPIFAP